MAFEYQWHSDNFSYNDVVHQPKQKQKKVPLQKKTLKSATAINKAINSANQKLLFTSDEELKPDHGLNPPKLKSALKSGSKLAVHSVSFAGSSSEQKKQSGNVSTLSDNTQKKKRTSDKMQNVETKFNNKKRKINLEKSTNSTVYKHGSEEKSDINTNIILKNDKCKIPELDIVQVNNKNQVACVNASFKAPKQTSVTKKEAKSDSYDTISSPIAELCKQKISDACLDGTAAGVKSTEGKMKKKKNKNKKTEQIKKSSTEYEQKGIKTKIETPVYDSTSSRKIKDLMSKSASCEMKKVKTGKSEKGSKTMPSVGLEKNAKLLPNPDDVNSDEDWSDIVDDGPEVEEFGDDDDDHTLDVNFDSDLKALLAELDFPGVRKQMEQSVESEQEEDKEYSDEEIEEECDNVDEIGNCHKVESPIKNNNDKCKKPIEESKRALLTSTDAAKLSASLAKFAKTEPTTGQQELPSAHGEAGALLQKMRNKLNVAKFRMINEQLYSITGADALKLFKNDPESFRLYHEGFKSQVALWPLNPLDVIVDWLKLQNHSWVVADFGCGEAELSERVQQKVHSLDLVASKPQVTVCDMAKTPLKSNSVNVAVFCLSLMGTNVKDFILEANRTLRTGGIMKIAEVESRISNFDEFVSNVQKYGFKCNKKPINHNYFITMDFRKFKDVKNKENLPEIKLKPCLYKKR